MAQTIDSTFVVARTHFDDMNNGSGWNRLPKSFVTQNTVFLLMTALIGNFYKAVVQR